MRYYNKNGLILTKIEEHDLSMLKSLKDESWFGTHTVAIINMADQKKWFNTTSSLVFKVIDTILDSFVGIFKIDNIHPINRTCDVGWDIFKEYRGKGLGKKLVQCGVDLCFDVLNVNRMDAEILSNNFASIKCAEAAGFIKEGCRRQAVYKSSKYIDSFIYGIVRDQWETNDTTI